MDERDPNFPDADEWASWPWPVKVIWLAVFVGIMAAIVKGATWLTAFLWPAA